MGSRRAGHNQVTNTFHSHRYSPRSVSLVQLQRWGNRPRGARQFLWVHTVDRARAGCVPRFVGLQSPSFHHFALPSPRIVERAEDPVSRLSGFPVSSAGKEFSCYPGDPSSIPRSGRSPGEGIGYPLQYSWSSLVAQLVKNLPAMWETWVPDPLEKGKCYLLQYSGLENSIDYSPWGHKESDTTERLSLYSLPYNKHETGNKSLNFPRA